MSDPRHPLTDMRQAETSDLFGELRRRGVPHGRVMEELGMRGAYRKNDPNIKRTALIVLFILTLTLIGIIGYLSITEIGIPDLLSGLAGSGVGAIAGILAGGDRGDMGK